MTSFDKIDLSIGQDFSAYNNYEQYKNINLSNNNFKYFKISRSDVSIKYLFINSLSLAKNNIIELYFITLKPSDIYCIIA